MNVVDFNLSTVHNASRSNLKQEIIFLLDSGFQVNVLSYAIDMIRGINKWIVQLQIFGGFCVVRVETENKIVAVNFIVLKKIVCLY